MLRSVRLAGRALIAAAMLLTTAAESRHHRPQPPASYSDASYDRAGYRTLRTGDYRRFDRASRDRQDDRRCDRGTTGSLLGAIAGGLLGNAPAGRHGNDPVGRDC